MNLLENPSHFLCKIYAYISDLSLSQNHRNIKRKFCCLVMYVGMAFLSGCDFFSPQQTFRLAIPSNDFTYASSAQHLSSFLKNGNFNIEIMYTENAIEANRLVAQGKADLTFIMNHSDFIPDQLNSNAGQIRTICPIFQRLFFLFSKQKLSGPSNFRELLEGKRIGIEVLGGETHSGLSNLLASSQLEGVGIVGKEEESDFFHFWGTYYGPRATLLIEQGWEEVTFDSEWIDFVTLNDPALNSFVLPAIPGVEGSKSLNTLSVQTLLVTNTELGDNAIYQLSQYIYQHRLELMRFDVMYRYISEGFDVSQLLFPLHAGTDAYFRRDQPSFFERYAEVLALIFSVGALLYGGLQALRSRILRKKKERIDHYFLDFLEIRSRRISQEEKISHLDELLQKALVQMTAEKLAITDFHIFSRLVQQELANLR